MKKLFATMFIAACGFCNCVLLSAQSTTRPLTLMTYNVRHCEGTDNQLDIARIASIIKAQAPEAIALQELDSLCTRTGKVYQAGELGRLTGMHATFGRAIPYQGGGYGIGLLSKEAPLSVRRIPVPGTEKRLLLVCEFEDYVYACTHLALEDSNRVKSLAIIKAEADRWSKPFFIAGDFNMTPSNSTMLSYKQLFKVLNSESVNTFPSDAPNRVIDYILSYRNSRQVNKRQVISETVASDHRPVLVELALPLPVPESVGALQQEPSAQPVYDLNGRRVDSENGRLSRGIYIQGRKKTCVR